jgi:hypothetical protein
VGENTPSIHSVIDTQPSEISAPAQTELSQILDYLRDIDDLRGSENQALADGLQAIRNDLGTLADFLRQRPEPAPPAAPPVPVKEAPRLDRSVGGSVVASPPREPRAAPAPAPRPVEPFRIPIPLTPPPMWSRPSSPDTLSEVTSFLSSHHSDDMSLLEADVYPEDYASTQVSSSQGQGQGQGQTATELEVIDEESSLFSEDSPLSRMESFMSSASYDSLSPGDSVSQVSHNPVSVSSATSAEITEGSSTESPASITEMAPSISDSQPSTLESPASLRTATSLESAISDEPVSAESPTISTSSVTEGTYLSRSSSPTSSTASGSTARPQQISRDMSPEQLPGMLDRLRDSINALKDGQGEMSESLNQLRDRGMPAELADRLGRLENLLSNLVDGGRGPPRPPQDSIYSSGSETSSVLDRLAERWDEYRRDRAEPPTIYMPTPMPARPDDLGDRLSMMLATPPPLAPAPVQAPPAFVPLVYRPVARGARPRSPSPVSFARPASRSASVPISEDEGISEIRRAGDGYGPPRPSDRYQRRHPRNSRISMRSEDYDYASSVGAGGPDGGRRPIRSGPRRPDIDFVEELRKKRRDRKGGDGFFDNTRPAPAVSPSQPVRWSYCNVEH